jgi:cation diffusion facilitator family transporter
MGSCCESKCSEIDQLKDKQKTVLIIVMIINFVMFFVEFFYGIISGSTALLADSLDMLGDASVYAFSLYVLGRTDKWKATAAFFKGIIITLFGIFVLVEALHKITLNEIPIPETMGIIGGIALAANLTCLLLLLKHRDDDVNMRSTWICSRNDIIANTGVISAAFLVNHFSSKWPDIIVGLIIAGVFLKSAFTVLSESIKVYRAS